MIYRWKISIFTIQNFQKQNFGEILRFFCLDLEAAKVAEICKISEKTIDKIFRAIRIKMAENCEQQAKLSGEIETRESYFGLKECVASVGTGLVAKPIWTIKTQKLCLYAGC